MNTEVVRTLTTLAAPIVTAAVGAAGISIQDRRKMKDLTLRHRERVEKAQLEVQFVTSWIQARKLLEPSARLSPEVEGWLDRCYQSARETSSVTPQQPRTPVLRRLLVLRPITGFGAETFRVAYWISFIFLNILVIASISELFAWMAPGGSDEGYGVLGFLFFLVISAIISFALRQFCIALDRSARLGSTRSERQPWPPQS
ncbi:hypothetical protein [Streptomyces triticiradicis]|uniref:Uncharacterized protein n=1 Tax=Streptomyces triticiradicis TaxID=2651189 RepID=A0A7J5D112_9ACTN|nr:hypothetical protein [Streptomyces triticiradicis]KAB1973038.1 hypothetical protein F8144_44360 [Streptomyces triticiradicis]